MVFAGAKAKFTQISIQLLYQSPYSIEFNTYYHEIIAAHTVIFKNFYSVIKCFAVTADINCEAKPHFQGIKLTGTLTTLAKEIRNYTFVKSSE